MNASSRAKVDIPALIITVLGVLLLYTALILPIYSFGTASYPAYIGDADDSTLRAIYEGDAAKRIWVHGFESVRHNLPPWEADPLPGYAYRVDFHMRLSADECTDIALFLDQFGIEYWIPHCD